MSSALSIVTSLSDYVNNPKFDRYDPAVCKSIHVKLDQETKDKGLSYDERFDAVKSIERRLTNLIRFVVFFSLGKKKYVSLR